MARLPGRLLAECIGTYALVFFGCGAVVVAAGTGIGLLGIALAHAIALGVMITATMQVSGGHLNPAVTLGLLSIRRIDAPAAAGYIVAQLAGAVLAAWSLTLLLPAALVSAGTLGTPALIDTLDLPRGIALEAIFTFFLMSAVMGTAVAEGAPKVGGFGIGLVLLFDILVGGSLTGAAMNPARAFGPALVTSTWYAQPVWWIGPIVGAVLAAQLWDRVILKR